MVITKDLSRLGRDYIDTGYYIEKYFPSKNKSQICIYLNENHITTPLKYKEETTNYKNPNKRFYVWSSSMISKILRDRIYVGDLVQHKHTKINYKVKKNIKVDPSQYIIVQNKHEPIIDIDTFNTVQKMLDKQSNEWTYCSSNSPHLLRGLVYCSCGGKVTYNKNHGKYFRCVCSSYKKTGAKFCNNIKYLSEDELISIVLENLRKNVKKYLDFKKLNYKIKKPKIKDNRIDIERQISLLEQKSMYEDKLNNIISTELFVQMSKELEEKKKV